MCFLTKCFSRAELWRIFILSSLKQLQYVRMCLWWLTSQDISDKYSITRLRIMTHPLRFIRVTCSFTFWWAWKESTGMSSATAGKITSPLRWLMSGSLHKAAWGLGVFVMSVHLQKALHQPPRVHLFPSSCLSVPSSVPIITVDFSVPQTHFLFLFWLSIKENREQKKKREKLLWC